MQPTSPPLPRESSFELLRILAQFFIVFYHLLLNVVFPDTGDPLYRALWLPLHIGVVLFVLISGYFGIRPGVKGLVRLVGTLAVYHLPLALGHRAIDGGGIWATGSPWAASSRPRTSGSCAPICVCTYSHP